MRKALVFAAVCAAISVGPSLAQAPNAVTPEGRGGGRGGGGATLPPALTPAWASQFKVLWIACGDNDMTTGAANVAFKAALKEKGVIFTDIVTTGGHSYSVWKRNMVAFAPLLFQ